jgi:23S rRNA C2498 (ribose-2'-O)-methylase RlmM
LAEVAQAPGADLVEVLDEHRILAALPDGFKSLFWLHRFRVDLEIEVPDLEMETVRSMVWGGLPLAQLTLASYGIQLTSNQRRSWSFQELVDLLRGDLGLSLEAFQPRSPEVVLSMHLHDQGGKCRILAGVSSARENLSVWASGQCRIPRDPEAVSRAEAKLLEAWEAFGMGHRAQGGRALDLGAAPGGWSRVLAGKGFRVEAVDPALLDSRVVALPAVTHHAETARSFLSRDKDDFALLVSDMKMDPSLAGDLLAACAPRLLRERGRMLTTLKLGKGMSALKQARDGLARLAKAYEILEARQLYFNRSEITVLARPLSLS